MSKAKSPEELGISRPGPIPERWWISFADGGGWFIEPFYTKGKAVEFALSNSGPRIIARHHLDPEAVLVCGGEVIPCPLDGGER